MERRKLLVGNSLTNPTGAYAYAENEMNPGSVGKNVKLILYFSKIANSLH